MDAGAARTEPPVLGPLPVPSARPLSPSRAELLDLLRESAAPMTIAALVSSTGLHGNTVREHLDALVRRGLVRRLRSNPQGRGRPAWLYELLSDDVHRSEYVGLATALALTLERLGEVPGVDVAAEARRTGEAWGRELAGNRGDDDVDPAAAREQVVSMQGGLGFATEPVPEDDDVLALIRCPLLETARQHPESVCSIHLGIVRGALEHLGADPDDAGLAPFDRAGACTLRLPSAG